MLSEYQNEPFGCLKSFSDLNGWRKQNVIVGDNADARMAKFLFKSRVAHHYRTHWRTRYKAGYITFENGKRFDVANQTIGGKQVFLFLATPEINILWRRQTLEYHIKDCVDSMAPNDKFAATQLARELADPELHDRRFRRYPFPAALRALSVSQLEELGELVAIRPDDQKASAPEVAA